MQKEAPGTDKIRPRTKSPSHKMRARQKETDQHVSHSPGWYDKSTLACFRWSVGIAKHDSGKLVCNLVLKPLTGFCSSNNFVSCTTPLHPADCMYTWNRLTCHINAYSYIFFCWFMNIVTLVDDINPFTIKISLVIFLTVCNAIVMMLVQRMWYWIYQSSSNQYSLRLLRLYWHCKDKFCLGLKWVIISGDFSLEIFLNNFNFNID